MISKQIQQVGITQYGTASANAVFAFARELLTASVSTTNQANPFSTEELKGTWEFIQWLNSQNHLITITEPKDLWKFSTFITYMVDLRDMSVVLRDSSAAEKINIKAQHIKNITQSANYTLSALSGDCDDYARLYDAALLNMANAYSLNTERYSVYFTPTETNQTGHVTYLYSIKDTNSGENEWHILNFYREYIWKGNPWEVAYLWATGYQKGYKGYDITIAQNQFSSANEKIVKTYSKPIASDSIENLVQNKHVNTQFSPTVINHTQDNDWSSVQNNAYALFEITPYVVESPKEFLNLSNPKTQEYLIYALMALGLIGYALR